MTVRGEISEKERVISFLSNFQTPSSEEGDFSD